MVHLLPASVQEKNTSRLRHSSRNCLIEALDVADFNRPACTDRRQISFAFTCHSSRLNVTVRPR
jgi:hypothetical protein